MYAKYDFRKIPNQDTIFLIQKYKVLVKISWFGAKTKKYWSFDVQYFSNLVKMY